MNSNHLYVKLLSEHACVPKKGSILSAGYDLYAAEDAVINGGDKCLIKTDISIIVPKGTYGRIAPRSGLAVKHYIDVGAGVIDGDYRGNVHVLLFNHSNKPFIVNKGDRIAQLILEKYEDAEIYITDELDITDRGCSGFGSTGV